MRIAALLILGCCLTAFPSGCGTKVSDAGPNTGVATIDVDDERAQSCASQVLRANGIEMVGGVAFGNDPDRSRFVIFVRSKDQEQAARLIETDAQKLAYRVTVHSPGGEKTINADLPSEPKSIKGPKNAEQMFGEGGFEQAIAEQDEAIRLNPENGDAYCERGVAYGQHGDLDKALLDLTKAIQLNPKLAEAFNARGITWAMSGNLDKAIADFDEAIRLAPNDAKAYSNRGRAYSMKGNQEEAAANFKRAKQLTPETSDNQ